ncbi:ATP-binding cassette domain-containing protein [Paenibacillus koleovorans]|uniref:ATP-binding cassette domain-containing protein n=1 Tax=Paenibacillus koleovorans TaxID=121608 RepID=UPI001FE74261|nr:ABC transporter ATP-binding protein [Paenibacillus koleovorans]
MDHYPYAKSFKQAAGHLYRIEKKPLLLLAVCGLLTVCLTPVELMLVKQLIDRIQTWTAGDPLQPFLLAASLLAGLLVFTQIVLGVPVPMAMARLSELGTLEQQRLLLHKTTQLPLLDVESPIMQDLRARASRASLYEISYSTIHFLQNGTLVALLLAVMVVFGAWLPALLACAAAWLNAAAAGRAKLRLEQVLREQTPKRRLQEHYTDLLTRREAAKEVRLFGLGGLLSQRWSALHDEQSAAAWQAAKAGEWRKLGPALLMGLTSGALVALLVLLPVAGGWSAGDFTLLLMALTMLLARLSGMGGQWAALREHMLRWNDFRAYMELEERVAEEASSAGCEGMERGGLQVSGLTFRYPGAEKDAVSEVSFKISPGSRVALVGENGSGKSTLIKLLSGLYPPTEGAIQWLGGQPGMAAVFQDFTRLHVTLRENMALGRPDASARDQLEALRAVGSRLVELDAQLGAPFGGVELSGGEWQKVAAARALVSGTAVVFYDEPTAALDPQAEKEAFELFLRAAEGRTALLVTHRLGAAKLADTILVMDDGRLVERGTHDELLRRADGVYSRMFRLQAAWYS